MIAGNRRDMISLRFGLYLVDGPGGTNMKRIRIIGLVLGIVALGAAAFGSSLSMAEPVWSGTGQTGLTTTGLGI